MGRVVVGARGLGLEACGLEIGHRFGFLGAGFGVFGFQLAAADADLGACVFVERRVDVELEVPAAELVPVELKRVLDPEFRLEVYKAKALLFCRVIFL